jgi:hypothetical protein
MQVPVLLHAHVRVLCGCHDPDWKVGGAQEAAGGSA